MSADQRRRELSRLLDEAAKLQKSLSDATKETSKARAAARSKRDQAQRTSSPSSVSMYLRDAERQEAKAADHERKVADASKKLAANSKKQSTVQASLDAALKDEQRQRDRADEQRRQKEKRHASEIARLTRPAAQYVHQMRLVEPPKPEPLRVLYLAANPIPDEHLRVDVEVRSVRDSVRRALHRDLVVIDHRPAATSSDLLDGLNELRPHVVHFSGHGGGGGLLFDDAEIRDRDDEGHDAGEPVAYGLLVRALAATTTPPKLLVLNACDTTDGADVLLTAVPAVIAMSADVSDVAATVFATKFYAAIASAQSVKAALEQASFAVDAAGLGEGDTPQTVVREGLDLAELILVQPVP